MEARTTTRQADLLRRVRLVNDRTKRMESGTEAVKTGGPAASASLRLILKTNIAGNALVARNDLQYHMASACCESVKDFDRDPVNISRVERAISQAPREALLAAS